MQISQIKYFYPVLFAVLPVVFSFNIWASEHRPIEILFLPLIVSLLSGTAITLICYALTRNLARASLLATTVLFGFFSLNWLLLLNQFLETTYQFTLPSSVVALATVIMIIIAIAASIMIFKKKCENQSFNKTFAQIATFLLLLQILVLVYNEGQLQFVLKPAIEAKQRAILNLKPLTPAKELPDIYFIVLDELGSSQVMEELFAHRFTKLPDALKRKGFTITTDSHSNYSITRHSLSSILNMTYLDFLKEIEPGNSHNLAPTTLLIQNNLTAQTLKQLGYNYYTLASEYPQSISSPQAKQNFRPLLEEFSEHCLQFTPLIFIPSLHKWIENSRVSNRYQNLNLLPSIQNKVAGPRFVFCHLLCPHEPFIFRTNGEIQPPLMPSRDKINHWTSPTKQAYVEQAEFIGTEIASAIEKLLAQSPRQPIIIIQGDHGPCSSGDMVTETPNKALYKERFCMFNAYLVPQEIKAKLYPSISPVNSFRLILSYLTNQEIPLLPDKCIFVTNSYPYRMKDVTGEIKLK